MSAAADGSSASAIVYGELASSRNSTRRDNAKRLKEVCDLMERDRVVLSVAEIARRCEPHGPAYSTICNSGSRLGDYVRMRVDEQIANQPSQGKPSVGVAQAVADPLLAAQFRHLESTVRLLKRENNSLRGLLKGLSPRIDIDAVINKAMNGAPLLPAPAEVPAPFPPALSAAILRLSDHLIIERRYELYKGRLTINRKIVLEVDQLEACRAAAGLDAGQWAGRYQRGET